MLPYVRSRLSEAVNAYAEDVALRSRLQALDDLLKQRLADEREKNLRLLTLFSKRIDHSENPDTWRRFPLLVAPFADAYLGDPEFGAVLDEVGELLTAWRSGPATFCSGGFRKRRRGENGLRCWANRQRSVRARLKRMDNMRKRWRNGNRYGQ